MATYQFTGNTQQFDVAHGNIMVALKVDTAGSPVFTKLAEAVADVNGDFTLEWSDWGGRVVIGALDDGTVPLNCKFYDWESGAVSTYGGAVLANNPIAFFECNETDPGTKTGILNDSSPNGNHGIIYDDSNTGALYQQPSLIAGEDHSIKLGASKTALGSGSVSWVPYHTDTFAIGGWFKLASIGNNTADIITMRTAGGPQADRLFLGVSVNGGGGGSLAVVTFNNPSPLTFNSPPLNLDNNQPHYLVINYNHPSRTIKAYVDGVLAIDATYNGSNLYGGTPFIWFGATSSSPTALGSSNQFTFDGLAIYGDEVSEAFIQETYTLGSP